MLQARQKWQKASRNLEVGDVVLVKEDDLVRCQWRLGKIIEVKVSKDKQVRTVRILMGEPNLTKEGKRTSKPTILERPIHKLVVLIENNVQR